MARGDWTQSCDHIHVGEFICRFTVVKRVLYMSVSIKLTSSESSKYGVKPLRLYGLLKEQPHGIAEKPGSPGIYSNWKPV